MSLRTHSVIDQQKKAALQMQCRFAVHPWGVEPQSTEPESVILSIELWVRDMFCKSKVFFLYLQDECEN